MYIGSLTCAQENIHLQKAKSLHTQSTGYTSRKDIVSSTQNIKY